MKRLHVVVAMLVVACGGTPGADSGIPDSGSDIDAGARDAGFDAGAPDAGFDAGAPDAGFDAGAPDASFDAGAPDAGVDAGAPDAGFDAGVPDAGFDAGAPDAGFDAGAPDAGFDGGAPDAGFDAGVDAGCGCTGLRCLADAGCGECVASSECGASRPWCDLSLSVCVACLETWNCGAGTWCNQGACVAGCGVNDDCRSGLCTPTHDCVNCQADTECGGGRVCGTGVCAAPCTTSTTCAVGQLCCRGACTNPQRDPRHCSACDVVCADNQFCGNGSCRALLLSNVCEQPVARVMLDTIEADDDAGLSIGQALANACTPPVAFGIAGQRDAGVLDRMTGEPLQLGELLVTGGGSFRQRAVAWLEAFNLAPVRDTGDLNTYNLARPDAGVIATGPTSTITPTHDLFVVQMVRTPYGATVLNAAGFYSEGTTAASWYLINTMLPVRATLNAGWYVVDWVDANTNGVPDSADQWVVVGSGPSP